MTLKQQQKQQELLLLSDLNYIIDNILINLQYDFDDNLYYLYNYYLENKYNLIDKVYFKIKSLKVDKLQEIPTKNGFKYINISVSKHNLNGDNEYQTKILIDELIRNKINNIIKEHKQQEKQKEYLQKQFINNNEDDNKSPPNKRLEIMGMSPISFIFANIFAIFEAFGNTKKRR